MESKHEGHQSPGHSGPGPSRTKWVFLGFLAIAGFLLITEHRAHLLGFLPWLFLLVCPLMHMFMHGGHGGHGHGSHGRRPPQDTAPGEEE